MKQIFFETAGSNETNLLSNHWVNWDQSSLKPLGQMRPLFEAIGSNETNLWNHGVKWKQSSLKPLGPIRKAFNMSTRASNRQKLNTSQKPVGRAYCDIAGMFIRRYCINFAVLMPIRKPSFWCINTGNLPNLTHQGTREMCQIIQGIVLLRFHFSQQRYAQI